MERVRVAEFISLLSDGGAQKLVVDYIQYIDTNKFDVMIIAERPRYDTSITKSVKEKNIKVNYLFQYNKLWLMLGRVSPYLRDIYQIKRIKQLLRKNKINVLHIHSEELKYIETIKNWIKFQNIKLIYTCHSEPEKYFEGRFECEKEAASQLIVSNDLQFIALREDMANKLNKMFNIKNTIVLPNGISFGDYERKLSMVNAKKRIGVLSDTILIGTVGRLKPVKNHKFLIKIFSEIKNLYSNTNQKVELLLVGDGPLEDEIMEYAQSIGVREDIHLLKRRIDVAELLCAMDIFVLPSLWEGFSLATLEAQVAGVPCVVSDAVPMIVKCSTYCEFLSLETDAEEWGKLIISLVGKKNSLEKNASDNYDISNIVRKLEQIYLSEI